MIDEATRSRIQRWLQQADVAGWLLIDFRGTNPIFADVVGRDSGGRRSFFFIPAEGSPRLLVHTVDSHRFSAYPHRTYRSRAEMVEGVCELVGSDRRVVMEYSPEGELPMMSYVDAGTYELLHSLGFTIDSSAALYQAVFAVWTATDLVNHRRAATSLSRVIHEAFKYIGANLGQVTERGVVRWMEHSLKKEGLEISSPNVSINGHTRAPHYELVDDGAVIGPDSWILIDLNARVPGSVYADITWVGYSGWVVPPSYSDRFRAVVDARDRALELLHAAHGTGRTLEGWELDRVARECISAWGYGDAFSHRLGHSLGRQAHWRGANLDDYESHDTRPLIPGLGFTIEPGIYGPDIGVRVEVDVYLHPDTVEVTTPIQQEVFLV